MKIQVYTAEESLDSSVLGLLVLLTTGIPIVRSFMQPNSSNFVLKIFVLLCIAVITANCVLCAMRARARRTEIILETQEQQKQPEKGVITAVTKKEVISKRGRKRYYQHFYYFHVDIYHEDGSISSIVSNAYTKPFHRYLRSSEVQVYTDKSGKQYYLEHFQLQRKRNETDCIPFTDETSKRFQKWSFNWILYFFDCVMFILILVELFFQK